MSASTPTADPQAPAARWLIGRLGEHRDLVARLQAEPPLLVIESDPLSGTSALLALTVRDLDTPRLTVDARTADSALDLAQQIATGAVSAFEPEAAAWWNGSSQVLDTPALRLEHRLAQAAIPADALRSAQASTGETELRHALELAVLLADGNPVLIAVDHLDALLHRVDEPTSRRILGILRAELQRPGSQLRLLLVGYCAGRLASAIKDPSHPLYQAGSIVAARRPLPAQFTDDLASASPGTDVAVAVVAAAAEIAAGAPAYVWRIVDETRRSHPHLDEIDDAGAVQVVTVGAWRRLRELAEPACAHRYQELASVHPAAPLIVSALASGLRPYSLGLNNKRVHDATTRLRARGTIFKAGARGSWTVSDPLLAAWARDHAPPSVRRRRGQP